MLVPVERFRRDDPMNKSQSSNAPVLTLTVRDALRATGIGRTLLYKLIDNGQLRRVKMASAPSFLSTI